MSKLQSRCQDQSCWAWLTHAACAQEPLAGRRLQQIIPPIPLPALPPFLGNLLNGLTGGSIGQATSLQSAGTTAAAAPAPSPACSCSATFAGVLGSEPELFFLSSALQLSGFASNLPSPSLGLTIFAPSNAAFLGLLDSLSAHPFIPAHQQCMHYRAAREFCIINTESWPCPCSSNLKNCNLGA